MQSDSTFENLTYVGEKPDIKVLRLAYLEIVSGLSEFDRLCKDSYDSRYNIWPGKNPDFRKHGADAFPWDGASDLESHVISERITKLVALLITSLNKANVTAMPVEMTDIPRSKMIANFLKWMISSGYIDRFIQEAELGANHFLEKGILITYVGWNREDRHFKQKLDLKQIAEISPEIAKLILSGDNDARLIELFKGTFGGVTDRKALRTLNDIRQTGVGELPIVRRQVDAPLVKTLSPDGQFRFPKYTEDPQRAPYCVWDTQYTVQEIEGKVITDGWDEEFVNYIITRYGKSNSSQSKRDRSEWSDFGGDFGCESSDGLVRIVHFFQRLIDKDDGSEGIYETVFHPDFDGNQSVSGYAKRELMNGYEDYPVVVSKLSEDSRFLYNTHTIPEQLKGLQQQIKVERDSRMDRNSMSTLPPLMYLPGNCPKDWGPGRRVAQTRKGTVEFGPTPDFDPGSIEIEQTLERQANSLVGMDSEDPLSQQFLQSLVNKFLAHHAKVVQQCFRCFQRFGPDEIFFRVTNSADQQVLNKGNADENFDVTITYDVLSSDPEAQANKLRQFAELIPLDRNGKFNIDRLLEFWANSIDPTFAGAVLQSDEESKNEITKQVTDDLVRIFSGIEMDARPNGAQAALAIIKQYTQQEDIMFRLQNDEAFRKRLEKYQQQYIFNIQQYQENPEIGRRGTAPAQVGAISTEGTQS